MPKQSSRVKEVCFIHKNCIGDFNKAIIRTNVCQDLLATYQYEENYYCILHLPNETKSGNNDFLQVVDSRIQKQQTDFTYTFVPDASTFFNKNFTSNVIFDSATFQSQADFRNKTFEFRVSFKNANFVEDAIFINSKFRQYADFGNCIFNKQANFNSSIFSVFVSFNSTSFLKDASFISTNFNGDCDFSRASFTNVFYTAATFEKDAYFNSTFFKYDAAFVESEFTQRADFRVATFDSASVALFEKTKIKGEIDFELAIIEGYLAFKGNRNTLVFEGNDVCLSLQDARIEKPERIHFHSVNLRPNWFINVDSRKFVFTNIQWESFSGINAKTNVESEFLQLKNREITNSEQLLKIACRQLAENAETNNRFEEASQFRNTAFEIEWLEKKANLKKGRKKMGNYLRTEINCSSNSFDFFSKGKKIVSNIWKELTSSQFIILHRLYRFSSSFGESSAKAFWLLVGIILLSSLLYLSPICKFGKGEEQRSLSLVEVIPYSLRVMLLQRPEPLPENNTAKWIVTIESLIAPLQLALLALAIRRKFMR